MVVPSSELETSPGPVPTLAPEVLLLLHVPPDVVSLKVVEFPRQIAGEPKIGVGDCRIVTIVSVVQPVGKV